MQLPQEITDKILAASFDVMNELGVGFLESVYEKALAVTLREKGLKVATQVPLTVYFHGEVIGQYFADLMVDDVVIVELKAVRSLLPEHSAQIINYLKATGIEVGLLINFGKPRIEFRRLHKD